jgi:MFS family permease
MRRLLIDLGPLRRYRDLRLLTGGQLICVLGNQLTAVAVPYQVYQLTRSSLFVGLVALAQLVPMVAGALLGGAVTDAVDRRRLLLGVEVLLAACSAGLALNAGRAPALWPLFVLPAAAAGLGGLDDAGHTAIIPRLVRRDEVASANAIFQSLFQFGGVAGPTVAGLLLAGTGIRIVYWADAASFGAAFAALLLIGPQPPDRAPGGRRLPSVTEGFRYVRQRQALQGAYLIDINAMVLGMPRALFPALAATVFGGGARTVGLLYSAPGAGALIGALTTGWVSRVRRQGRAVIVAVIVWGLAITGFGAIAWLAGRLPGHAGVALATGLVLLAAAGWADVISAVFRSTIVQLSVPSALQGRLSGLHIAVVTGGPSLGSLESGAVATAFGNVASVISGGVGCVVGAVLLARLLPGFRRLRLETAAPDTPAGAGPGAADAGRADPPALGPAVAGGEAAP